MFADCGDECMVVLVRVPVRSPASREVGGCTCCRRVPAPTSRFLPYAHGVLRRVDRGCLVRGGLRLLAQHGQHALGLVCGIVLGCGVGDKAKRLLYFCGVCGALAGDALARDRHHEE